ncbi:hypothetical protein BOW51_03015, partial [Solemya velesiana gill symbiont]
ALYDQVYCARGDMENRIKEQQLGLFAERTSAHHWWANQFRLLLSSLAYVLMEAIRRLALHDTELANAQVSTLRLRLPKIGAVILRNTRRIRFLLSSSFPYQALFRKVAERLVPGSCLRVLPRHVDKQRGKGGGMPGYQKIPSSGHRLLEGKQSRHPNTACSHWEATVER